MARLIGQERSGHRLDRYWLHVGDDGKDRITVESIEDVEPIVEANKAEYNDFNNSRFAPPKEKNDPVLGRRVASIPGTIIEELCRVHKISFRELMLSKTDRSQMIWNRFLNDPAFRNFRTAPGRVDLRRMR